MRKDLLISAYDVLIHSGLPLARTYRVGLHAAVLLGSSAASAAPAPTVERATVSASPEGNQNVCVTGKMKWLLVAAYHGLDVCRDKSTNMVARVHKVAELRGGPDKYELYDYTYSFQASTVRHGGARLLIAKNGKYAGQYDGAAGGVWKVHGAVASVFWPETRLTTQSDFSHGPPHALQQADGGYTFLE